MVYFYIWKAKIVVICYLFCIFNDILRKITMNKKICYFSARSCDFVEKQNGGIKFVNNDKVGQIYDFPCEPPLHGPLADPPSIFEGLSLPPRYSFKWNSPKSTYQNTVCVLLDIFQRFPPKYEKAPNIGDPSLNFESLERLELHIKPTSCNTRERERDNFIDSFLQVTGDLFANTYWMLFYI